MGRKIEIRPNRTITRDSVREVPPLLVPTMTACQKQRQIICSENASPQGSSWGVLGPLTVQSCISIIYMHFNYPFNNRRLVIQYVHILISLFAKSPFMNLGSCHNNILCLLSLITVYPFTVGLHVFPESRISLWNFLKKCFRKIFVFSCSWLPLKSL